MKNFDSSLYFITDSTNYAEEEFLCRIEQALKGGVTLIQLREKNKKLEETIAQMQKNESNRQKAVGSVRGSKAAAAEDAFLSGLFGD